MTISRVNVVQQITKVNNKKKKKTFFQLFINKKNSKFENIDKLLLSIRRSQLFIVIN